jgi:hypothetical protein
MAQRSGSGPLADHFLVVRYRGEVFAVPWEQLVTFRSEALSQQESAVLNEFFSGATKLPGYEIEAALAPGVVVLDGDIAPPEYGEPYSQG